MKKEIKTKDKVMKIKSGITTIVLASLLFGCGKEKKEVAPEGKVISIKAQQTSEELALAGEQIFGPFTFMLADEVFKVALEKDPANKRAQFYRAFAKPLMAFHGIAKRVRPLVKEYGDEATFDRDFARIPDSSFKSFLLADHKNGTISTEKQAQQFLIEVRDGFNEFRMFLKKNPGFEMNLNLNYHLWEKTIRERMYRNCYVVTKWNNQEYPVDTYPGDKEVVIDNAENWGMEVECDPTMMAKIGINAADAMALQQIAAGFVLYLTPYTSYDASGAIKVIETNDVRKQRGLEQLSSKEAISMMEQNNDFGKLLAGESFSLLTTLGSDVAAAWKWAMSLNHELCPSNNHTPWVKVRPNMMFEDGICIRNNTESRTSLNMLNNFLVGATSIVIEKSVGQKRKINLDPFAISRNPVANIKSLMPKTYNACDRAESFRDKTMGGILPDGNADELLSDTDCKPAIYR